VTASWRRLLMHWAWYALALARKARQKEGGKDGDDGDDDQQFD